jgi:hypothetical protein
MGRVALFPHVLVPLVFYKKGKRNEHGPIEWRVSTATLRILPNNRKNQWIQQRPAHVEGYIFITDGYIYISLYTHSGYMWDTQNRKSTLTDSTRSSNNRDTRQGLRSSNNKHMEASVIIVHARLRCVGFRNAPTGASDVCFGDLPSFIIITKPTRNRNRSNTHRTCTDRCKYGEFRCIPNRGWV